MLAGTQFVLQEGIDPIRKQRWEPLGRLPGKMIPSIEIRGYFLSITDGNRAYFRL
jgi:hypothetical protein